MTDGIRRALRRSLPLAPYFDQTTDAATLWIAFSGGVDSTVLLHALREVRQAVAIHIDHGLDPASGDWAAHCAAVADEFGVPFEVRTVCVDATGNREQAARRARYARWRELLGPGDLLALGHHADDQAETRVWQLLTGRAPGGMPSERPLGVGRLVRPLLGVRRRGLAAYAKHHGLRWIEDPSNAELDLDRNAIRHQLMSRIEDRHPGAVARLARPRTLATACLRPMPADGANGRSVEAWLLAAGLPVPRAAVTEIVRQNAAYRDRNPRVRIVPGIHAWRYDDVWHLVRDAWHLVRDAEDRCRDDAGSAMVGEDRVCTSGSLTWNRAAHGLPSPLALALRPRSGGERLRPAGREVTKTVKALFQEARLPPWQRDDWPLLYAGARLVAVPGLAVASDAVVAGGWVPKWTPDAERQITDPVGTIPRRRSGGPC